MVVEVGLEALVLRHLNHLVDIALAAFEKAVELGLFQPLRVVWKPREKGMIVVIDLSKVRASSARAEKTCVTVGSPKALGSDTKVVEKSFPPLERVSKYFT